MGCIACKYIFIIDMSAYYAISTYILYYISHKTTTYIYLPKTNDTLEIFFLLLKVDQVKEIHLL